MRTWCLLKARSLLPASLIRGEWRGPGVFIRAHAGRRSSLRVLFRIGNDTAVSGELAGPVSKVVYISLLSPQLHIITFPLKTCCVYASPFVSLCLYMTCVVQGFPSLNQSTHGSDWF